MLEIRLNYKNCNKPLPNENSETIIFTYVCTFCAACAEGILFNVCPNCGGGFEKRPTRPKDELLKNPASKKVILKPVSTNRYLDTNKDINPRKR